MTYGEQIKSARVKKRLTQEELAEQLDVSRQAVSKWEADKSRPAAAKLTALSAVLEIPEDTWEAIEREERAAREIRPATGRGWKIAVAALALLLCVSAAINALLWHQWQGNGGTSSAVPPDGGAADISAVFPETFSLRAQTVEAFGAWPLEVTGAETVVSDSSAEVVFTGRFPDGSRLQILRANPVQEIGTTFYDVYAVYFKSAQSLEEEPIPLGRLAANNHYVGNGIDAEYFTGVLGRDGWRISLGLGAACEGSWYFCVDPGTGEVYPLLRIDSGGKPAELDLDEDGQKEIVTYDGLPMRWFIYDTLESGECVSYELDQDSYGVVPVSFYEEEGFVVTNDAGTVLARYILREGALLRQAALGFSVLDYPDVSETKLFFITASEESDVRDPEEVLDNGTVRITRRQQALLALQTLYDLTGLRVAECFCAASENGLAFYAAEDGGPGTLFYNVMLGKRLGGAGWLSGFHIYWREETAGSPLSFAAAKHQAGTGSLLAEWWISNYAADIPLFCRGEIVHVAANLNKHYEDGWYVLYREDGTYYSARILDTETGYALTDFYGPYAAA